MFRTVRAIWQIAPRSKLFGHAQLLPEQIAVAPNSRPLPELGSTRQTELVQCIGHVKFDRVGADSLEACNFRIGQPMADRLRNTPLGRGEHVVIRGPASLPFSGHASTLISQEANYPTRASAVASPMDAHCGADAAAVGTAKSHPEKAFSGGCRDSPRAGGAPHARILNHAKPKNLPRPMATIEPKAVTGLTSARLPGSTRRLSGAMNQATERAPATPRAACAT